ncbi:porin [Photobacterium swingsii]|uniref:porin n=1 Tax=Photobacterium swingsii TaxID=680026 RepID=UPI0040689D97
MKKAVLASAVLATLTSGIANAATVYQDDTNSLKIGGRAEARFNVSDNHKYDSAGKENGNDTFKDKSRARINLKGKSDITDSLTAFGTYELEVKDGKGQAIDTRYLFAGLDTNFGAFSYGQQDSAQVILTDFTDILATFGGDAADLVSGNGDKKQNNFVYSGNFDALTVTANYIVNENDKKDTRSYGLSAVYELPFGLDFGAGYVGGKESADTDVNQYNLVARYSLENFMVSGLYAGGKSETGSTKTDLTGYELAAAYQLNQFIFQGVYNKQQAKVDGKKTDNQDYIAIEGIYKINSSLRTYAGYKFNQLDKNTDKSANNDELQAGIRFDF